MSTGSTPVSPPRKRSTTGASPTAPAPDAPRLEQFLRRRHRQRLLIALAVIAAIVLIAVADRAGWFTQAAGDLWRYDQRSFILEHIHIQPQSIELSLRPPDTQPHRHDKPAGNDTSDFTRVRLLGVMRPPDAPDFDLTAAAEAGLVPGRMLRLQLDPAVRRAADGTLLAHVLDEHGQPLAGTLLRAGLVTVDPRVTHAYRNTFALLERQARRDGTGLWRR